MDILSWTFGNFAKESYDSNKPIFIDASNPSFHITAAEARLMVRQLIAGLRASGLKKGDTVCILTLSNIYYPIFFLGIIGAGGQVAGGNPGHTVPELRTLLQKCAVKAMITEPKLLDKARSACEGTNLDPELIYLYNGYDTSIRDSQSWRNLLTFGQDDWDTLTEAEASTTVSAFYSTSGTTGAPKFAAVSHAYQTKTGEYIETETASKPYGVSRLVSLPLMHAFAAPTVHTAALRCGTPVYILPRFSPTGFLAAILKNGITEFPAVPSMLALLEQAKDVAPALASVREVMCAGAPLGSLLADSFSAVLTHPSARLVQLYGATEASWISSTPYLQHEALLRQGLMISGSRSSLVLEASDTATNLQPTPTPTVGMPLPGYQIRLVDPTSGITIAGSHVPGTLEVRVPHPFMFYIDAEKATYDSFAADGWLKTGDIAMRDDSGSYYIVDREKDMIKVRGWQVAPSEIEAALGDHPDIVDCAVLGTEDRRGSSGEVPVAFVSLRQDESEEMDQDPSLPSSRKSSVDATELKSFLKQRLAGYKVPEHIEFVAEIPRNPAGKILRRALREEHLADPSAEKPLEIVMKDAFGGGADKMAAVDIVSASAVQQTANKDGGVVFLATWSLAAQGSSHGMQAVKEQTIVTRAVSVDSSDSDDALP